MRIALELTLLATLTISATALGAPPASAQSLEPMLHNQTPRMLVAAEVHAANDVACPAVTPSPPSNPSPLATAGGCRLHFSAPDSTLVAHLTAGGTEVVVSTCTIEFDVRLDSAGEGWISHQELTPGTVGSCTRKACGQVSPPTGEGRAYTVYLREAEVAGQGPREDAVVLLCQEDVGGAGLVHCDITVPMSQPTPHRYRLTAADISAGGASFPHCEFTGTFDQESVLGTTGEGQLEQNVEIRHT